METSAWLAAIIAVAAVAVQIAIAWSEHRARAKASQPQVSVDFGMDPQEAMVVRFIVQNTGASVARNVRISLEPEWSAAQGLESPPTALASLPPGRRMEWSVDVWTQRLGSDLPNQYLVTIEGDGPAGAFRDSYTLALSDWTDTVADPPGTLKGIAKAIAKMADGRK